MNVSIPFERVVIPIKPYGQTLRINPLRPHSGYRISQVLDKWIHRWEKRTGMTASTASAYLTEDHLIGETLLHIRWKAAELPSDVDPDELRNRVLAPTTSQVIHFRRLDVP